MSEDMTALAVKEQQSLFVSPAASLQEVESRYRDFNIFINKQLMSGTDYMTIPGTPKPSLLKPGAEKLCTFFALSPRFTLVEQEKDWTGEHHNGEPFFYFAYRCDLYRGDVLIASCDGSCNSWEVKYRYRNQDKVCPKCGKPAIIKGKAQYGGGWLCYGKKGGCGAKFDDADPSITSQQTGKIPNPDICDQVNTFQKMAQKRAFVGASLLATNSSERFTQDIEDMSGFGLDEDVIDGNYTTEQRPPDKRQKNSNAVNQESLSALNIIGKKLWPGGKWDEVKAQIGKSKGGDIDAMLKFVNDRMQAVADDKALSDHIAKAWPGLERTLPIIRGLFVSGRTFDIIAGVAKAAAVKASEPSKTDNDLADIVLTIIPETEEAEVAV